MTVVVRTGGTAEWAAISAAVLVGAEAGTRVASLSLRDYSSVSVGTVLDGLFGFDDNLLELAGESDWGRGSFGDGGGG